MKSAYELGLEREARIAANEEKLRELGLADGHVGAQVAKKAKQRCRQLTGLRSGLPILS